MPAVRGRCCRPGSRSRNYSRGPMMKARALLLALALAFPAVAQDQPQPTALSIRAADTEEKDAGRAAKLIGPEARLQVVVTATLPDGKLRDWTGAAKYSTEPAGI